MKLLIVLAAAIAYVAADCSPMQRLKVKNQWAKIYANHDHRIEFNTEVWREFFHDHPAAIALFDRVHGENIYSPDFRAHMDRVNAGVDMTIELLDDPDALAAELAHLKKQHEGRPGSGDHIEGFLTALMDIIAHEDILCFDQEAWSACLHEIATGIFG